VKLFLKDHYYKHTLDFVIVELLDVKYPSYLRYYEIEKEVSLYHKVPSKTLSLHLRDLRLRNALEKIKQKNNHTFYSLTNEFKVELDIQKRNYPIIFVKEALSLRRFTRSNNCELNWGIPADED